MHHRSKKGMKPWMYHHLDAKPIGASKHNQGYKEIKPGNTGCDNTVSPPEKSSMDLFLCSHPDPPGT
jgi:hypothetical protein